MSNEGEELPSSELGTKEYWDKQYELEKKNFDEIGDKGEVWFGEAAMNRIFKGGRFFGNSNFSLLFIIYRWNFVTMANKTDSVVTKRHREEEPAFPFFS